MSNLGQFSQNDLEIWILKFKFARKFYSCHFRSNKSLPAQFVVLVLHPVADGTKVSVAAGNEENNTADVKNNVAEFSAQMARFSDLRFVGKSGRGKSSLHLGR